MQQTVSRTPSNTKRVGNVGFRAKKQEAGISQSAHTCFIATVRDIFQTSDDCALYNKVQKALCDHEKDENIQEMALNFYKKHQGTKEYEQICKAYKDSMPGIVMMMDFKDLRHNIICTIS